ncbi:hypothetical protein HQ560_16150 [bacterium]|nr:hypothetical protein [bacterium]
MHESPRRGSRLEAGVITLQGHDPTTDLSFRNLRIAEYPKREPGNQDTRRPSAGRLGPARGYLSPMQYRFWYPR